MRYAVYFCPAPESALGLFGSEWLATTSIPGIACERFQILLADVRRYGWHATLSAPFELTAHADSAMLHHRVREIAQSFKPFDLPLRIDRLAGFLALRPCSDETQVHALAERCVRELNSYRAPVSNAAWQRRIAGLDNAEKALFREYGYPYVLERFRFHMTLSAPASAEEELALREYLLPRLGERAFARIDTLTICTEAYPGADFECFARFALGGELAA